MQHNSTRERTADRLIISRDLPDKFIRLIEFIEFIDVEKIASTDRSIERTELTELSLSVFLEDVRRIESLNCARNKFT